MGFDPAASAGWPNVLEITIPAPGPCNLLKSCDKFQQARGGGCRVARLLCTHSYRMCLVIDLSLGKISILG